MSVKEIVKRITKMSTFKVISDSVYIAINYAVTGNVVNAFCSLSALKVTSAVAYVAWDSVNKRLNDWAKALGWEAIITALGFTVNFVTTGSLPQASLITVLMKVMIPIYVAHERLWNHQPKGQ